MTRDCQFTCIFIKSDKTSEGKINHYHNKHPDKPVRDLLCICAFNLFCWVVLAFEADLGFGCATAIVVGFVLLMELELRDMAGIKGIGVEGGAMLARYVRASRP